MFVDRLDAGRQLAEKMQQVLGDRLDIVVFAIPRGGLPIGALVARQFGAPLDVILTKKIGAPGNPELAIGAATPSTSFIDPAYDVPSMAPYVQQEVARVQALLKVRALAYWRGVKPIARSGFIKGHTVVIVDDGVATGQTVLAAINELRERGAKRIIVAVPVISTEAYNLFTGIGVEVIAVLVPVSLLAIGTFYENFAQVSDEEAALILQKFKQPKMGKKEKKV